MKANVKIIEFVREPYADVYLKFSVQCLGSALFWAVPILTKHHAEIHFEQPVHTPYSEIAELPYASPIFWPAATKPPLDMPIPFDSDSGSKSIADEAVAAWVEVQEVLQKSAKRMTSFGTHKCIWEGMKIGMASVSAEISVTIKDSGFHQLLIELTQGDLFPETRLFGFILANEVETLITSEDGLRRKIAAISALCPFWIKATIFPTSYFA